MARTVLISAEAIANVYRNSSENVFIATQKPKKKVYNSLNALLQESCLLGATRFGQNFIA